MGSSPGFGSNPGNYGALFGLAFATAPPNAFTFGLTLLPRKTRRLIMQKARGHPAFEPCGTKTRLPLIVGTRFQVLFHSPPGVLFTFPSRYLFTISQSVVFSLRRWSSQIPAGFPVSRGTWELHRRRCPRFCLQGFHLLWLAFPGQFSYPGHFFTSPLPDSQRGEVPLPCSGNGCRLWHPSQFRLFPFRSPLLRESRLFSFPPGTEMFHFPGFAPSVARWLPDITPVRFTDSGIAGSKVVRTSPTLIAAYHALHRL